MIAGLPYLSVLAEIPALRWLQSHVLGWEVLVPAVAPLGLFIANLRDTARQWQLPWIIAAFDAGCAAALYLRAPGLHRFWYFDRAGWLMMIGVLLLCSAIPLLAGAAAAMTGTATGSRRATVLLCTLFGSLAVPVADLCSTMLGRLYASM